MTPGKPSDLRAFLQSLRESVEKPATMQCQYDSLCRLDSDRLFMLLATTTFGFETVAACCILYLERLPAGHKYAANFDGTPDIQST